jgi:hypothetical protein
MPMLPQPGDCLPTDYGFDPTHRLEKIVTADAMTVAKIPSPGCFYSHFVTIPCTPRFWPGTYAKPYLAGH